MQNRDTGQTARAYELRDGKSMGLSRYFCFNDQGKLRYQGQYALDGRYAERPVGVHQIFHANGKLAVEGTYDTKGNVARQKVWDESGVLQSDDALFEDGSRKAYAK